MKKFAGKINQESMIDRNKGTEENRLQEGSMPRTRINRLNFGMLMRKVSARDNLQD